MNLLTLKFGTIIRETEQCMLTKITKLSKKSQIKFGKGFQKMVNWLMCGAMALPNIGGWAGTLVTIKSGPAWYKTLTKPEWHPPNWTVWPVWSTLYISMGYASYLVWKEGGGFHGRAKYPLMLYGTQLTLNWTWTPIFFGMHRMGMALINIALLYGTVAATAISFHGINPTAGLIMTPYLGWLTFTSFMYYCIWRDNKDNKDNKRGIN